MRKKLLAIMMCAAMAAGMSSAAFADEAYDLAVITMDSIDQHWVSLIGGAQEAADAAGATLTVMSPEKKDDALQIEAVNNAVAKGVDGIIIAANSDIYITLLINKP